jgi:hypothetical protein
MDFIEVFENLKDNIKKLLVNLAFLFPFWGLAIFITKRFFIFYFLFSIGSHSKFCQPYSEVQKSIKPISSKGNPMLNTVIKHLKLCSLNV